ncbi:ABC transporter permease [Alkalihalobacillus sp. 1P02AB]|uniref:ABC transporter permease n=1 Tax=Alkalihalobacillus sp. 1P02AB TaxID=3132260 RepID=UPI0039A6F33F
MRNSLKVAKWEIKRNLLNKSFIISIVSTPLLFLLFFSIPMLFSGGDGEEAALNVYINDPLELWAELENELNLEALNWEVEDHIVNEGLMLEELKELENSVYLSLTEEEILTGHIPVHMSDDLSEADVYVLQALQSSLKQIQLEQLGFEVEEATVATAPIVFEPQVQESNPADGSGETEAAASEFSFLERLVPGIFAGVILFSVVITGMMIFTSASQEKKEKVSEMILSSITPYDLMQGKIIGYFALGIIQVTGWIVLILPFLVWYVDFPLLSYLFVPELLVLVVIAIAGYLLFASIFVGIGATVDEVSSTSNFQGIVFMLPWLPFILIGPILADPEGLIAQIGSYVPFTAPGVLIIRLSMLEQWPWIEIIISLVILFVSIWLLMKLAGKVFKTGILMYGKNATPKEILKWIKQ